MANSSKNEIRPGDYIILRKEKVFKVIQVRKDRKIYVEKKKFTLNGIIGHPYGSTFELQGGQLVKATVKNYDADFEIDEEAGADNRNVVDDSENQKMSREDLLELRQSGATGDDIVGQLVENSATFKEKTEFAQQKYLKKKKKKYAPLFTILKPCSRLLCQMYMNKGPHKICGMRLDSLGQILTQANVRPGNRMMVVESCMGLLVGALLERMAGQGLIMQFYNGSAPIRTVLEAYDFPSKFLECLHSFSLELISTIRQKVPDLKAESPPGETEEKTALDCDASPAKKTDKEEEKVEAKAAIDTGADKADNLSTDTGADKADNLSTDTGADKADILSGKEKDAQQKADDEEKSKKPEESKSDVNDETKNNGDEKAEEKRNFRWSSQNSSRKRRPLPTEEEKQKRREARLQQLQDSRDLIKQSNMDGLIVATRYHPTPIVLALREYVMPSRPIIVFSQYKEPLLDCYQKLRDHGDVICLRLTETWLREYQVLPDRTHPKMQMSGAGGYLLTGITVEK